MAKNASSKYPRILWNGTATWPGSAGLRCFTWRKKSTSPAGVSRHGPASPKADPDREKEAASRSSARSRLLQRVRARRSRRHVDVRDVLSSVNLEPRLAEARLRSQAGNTQAGNRYGGGVGNGGANGLGSLSTAECRRHPRQVGAVPVLHGQPHLILRRRQHRQQIQSFVFG